MTPSRRKVESYTLRDAAKDGRLFIVRCSMCRKVDAYLASDLVEIWNPSTPAVYVFDVCRHCGSGEWLSARMRFPTSDDVGHLRLRRPAGVRTVQLWKDDWYG